jgi:hypothetical protein
MQNLDFNNKSEKVLNSFDGLQQADAPDFFYTRLIGRMQKQQPDKKNYFLLRPIFLSIPMLIILLCNIVALVKINHQVPENKIVRIQEDATIQSFAKTYNLTIESVYE